MTRREWVKMVRERHVTLVASYGRENPSDEDIAKARTLMASFYRLCGLADRNLYRANDERTCNSIWLAQDEEREARWIKRLSKQFHDFCGLNVDYMGGYLPEIVKITGSDRRDRCSYIVPIFYD